MNHRARYFCLAVIAAACLLIPLLNWQALSELPAVHVWGLVSLIAVAVLSEFLSFTATVGSHKASSSILFIPLFACVLLFPPPAAVFMMAVTSAFTQLFIHKRPLLRGSFNAAQTSLSIYVANAVYESTGGVHSVPLSFDLLSLQSALSLAALATTFFFTNQLLASTAIALINGDRVGLVFSRVVAPSGGNFLYDVLASPIAVVVALLYSSLSTWGIIIGILPLLIIRHSYQTNVKLHQANKDLLSVLVKTIETRDPYTSGHSIRVSILARAIAEDMDLSLAMVNRIEMAALVHDIGKVDAVYTAIIQKEGSLTESERNIITTHAAKGAEFLETLSSFREDVIEGVRHHHERYDGTGYPSRLKSDDIPLAARIIMLCDSIDAMLSDRPYRKALSTDDVRLELLRCAGTQFDPRIVDVILKRNTLERAADLVRPEKPKSPQLIAVSA
jgi:putative nucleotidyltransferase with HDIG domain